MRRHLQAGRGAQTNDLASRNGTLAVVAAETLASGAGRALDGSFAMTERSELEGRLVGWS
ncbi:MAG TPA: hypothetical protein VH165_02435 [Kofleriaceae bacterium]|jgi:hypothetical protein|nr:hypothetical protein [Kofleriaceae bacterium]